MRDILMTMDSAIVVGVAHIKVSQLQLVSDAARVGEFALALKKNIPQSGSAEKCHWVLPGII